MTDKYPPPEEEPDAGLWKGMYSALLIYGIFGCVCGIGFIGFRALTANW